MLDSGVCAQLSGDQETALIVALLAVFSMGEEVADKPPVTIVLERSRLEALAEALPGDCRVQKEATVGRRDRQNEPRSKALPETRGDDESALVVKGVLGLA